MCPNLPAMRTTNQQSRRHTGSRRRNENRMNLETIYLEYACYICGDVQATATDTRNHIKRFHGHYISPQPSRGRRPEGVNYVFGSKGEESDRYACASCWFDCPKDLDILNKHTIDMHSSYPIMYEEYDNQGEYYEVEEEDISRVKDNEGRHENFSSSTDSVPAGSRCRRRCHRNFSSTDVPTENLCQDFSSTYLPYGSDQIDRILRNLSNNARRNRSVSWGKLMEMAKALFIVFRKFCTRHR